jgi:hypothetical protein
MKNSLKQLKETIELILDLEIQELDLEMINDLMYTKNDFNFKIDNQEYRCINEDAIWDIYLDEQQELIQEVYLGRGELPWWFKIDWQATCENILNSDGYGNHFSTYDGSEENFGINGEGWYLFRTN